MLDQICPKCGVRAVNRDKIKPDHFYCFPKNGGCGLRFNKVIRAIEKDNNVILFSHTIFPNKFLKMKVPAYFCDWYIARGLGGSDFSELILKFKDNADASAINEARDFLFKNLYDIISIEDLKHNLTVEIVITSVPRSKPDSYYFDEKSLKFREAVNNAVTKLSEETKIPHRLTKAGGSIKRILETMTTHKKNSYLPNDGPPPYPGITKDTCSFSENIKDKTVILVDDIYTYDVGVDEDCIQFLYDSGARNVILYTLGMTQKLGNFTKVIPYNDYINSVKK